MILPIAIVLGALAVLGGPSSPPPTSQSMTRPPPPLRWTTDGYTAELSPWGDGWRWRVWYAYAGPGQTLAEGWRPTADEARRDASSWIAVELEQPGNELAAEIRRGLRVANECNAITVVQIDEWIAWAAPRMPEPDAPVDPAGFMLAMFAELFPECSLDPEDLTVRGRRFVDQAQAFGRALEANAAGTLLDVADSPEILAARMVGLSVPKRPGAAQWVDDASGHRWAVVVDPHPSGAGWRWRVWPDRRQGEPAAERSNLAGRDAAIAAAQAWIQTRRPPR